MYSKQEPVRKCLARKKGCIPAKYASTRSVGKHKSIRNMAIKKARLFSYIVSYDQLGNENSHFSLPCGCNLTSTITSSPCLILCVVKATLFHVVFVNANSLSLQNAVSPRTHCSFGYIRRSHIEY